MTSRIGWLRTVERIVALIWGLAFWTMAWVPRFMPAIVVLVAASLAMAALTFARQALKVPLASPALPDTLQGADRAAVKRILWWMWPLSFLIFASVMGAWTTTDEPKWWGGHERAGVAIFMLLFVAAVAPVLVLSRRYRAIMARAGAASPEG